MQQSNQMTSGLTKGLFTVITITSLPSFPQALQTTSKYYRASEKSVIDHMLDILHIILLAEPVT